MIFYKTSLPVAKLKISAILKVMNIFNPLEFLFWITGFVILGMFITYYFAKNRIYTLLVGLITTLVVITFGGAYYLDAFLENHSIAIWDKEKIHHVYETGWPFVFHAWPIWVIPCLLTSILTALLILWFMPRGNKDYLQIIQQAGKTTPPISGSPATSHLILKQLEINELERKLKLAEEKFKIIKNESPQKSVRTNKYVSEIRDLRAKLMSQEQEITTLNKDCQLYKEDLERANALIDTLMSEKFSE